MQGQLTQIAEEMAAAIQEIQAGLAADLQLEQAQATFDIASQDNSHQNKMRELGKQGQLRSVGNNESS